MQCPAQQQRAWLEDAEWRRTWDLRPGFTHYLTYVTPSPIKGVGQPQLPSPTQHCSAFSFLSLHRCFTSDTTSPSLQLQGAQDKDT